VPENTPGGNIGAKRQKARVIERPCGYGFVNGWTRAFDEGQNGTVGDDEVSFERRRDWAYPARSLEALGLGLRQGVKLGSRFRIPSESIAINIIGTDALEFQLKSEKYQE